MEENGFITAEPRLRPPRRKSWPCAPTQAHVKVHAEYVAETVRQLVHAQYGDDAYTRGLNVFTTLKAADQEAAYKALRKGIMDYERRQIYRGPEKFVTCRQMPRSRKTSLTTH
jgi:penicillin-binding protein 1A